jgi:hypothetical protein
VVPPGARGRELQAVRTELRGVLYDLADALLVHAARPELLEAIRHAWVLADLAELDAGLVRTLLRNLQRDLRGEGSLDSVFFANQLNGAADKL